MKKSKMYVQLIPALDFYDNFTFGALTFMDKIPKNQLDTQTPPSRKKYNELLMKAMSAVTKHPCWDEPREEPRIGYNPKEDDFYFIFKAENNGNTFLVSHIWETLPDIGEIEDLIEVEV